MHAPHIRGAFLTAHIPNKLIIKDEKAISISERALTNTFGISMQQFKRT